MADNTQQAQRMFQAWEDRDFNSLEQDLADDVRVVAPGGQTVTGKQAVRQWYEAWATAFTDATAGGQVTLSGDNGVTVEGVFKGTNDAQFADRFPPTNQSVSVPFINVLHFENDKVSEVSVYYDSLLLMTQLGHVQDPMT
jgi:steroid delta-isomerase-like uncharacterized protein